MQEIWKDITGYEWYYQVSNLGRVISVRRNTMLKWDIIKGYQMIKMSIDGKMTRVFAHRLVAIAFIPNPDCKKTVNHINWIKTDNRLENLEWMTHGENAKHSYKELWRKNWTEWLFWIDNKNSKIVLQLNKLGELVKEWWSMIDIERTLWIPHSNISSVCNWKKKSARGFIWKFKV